MLAPIDEWRRLEKRARPDLKELLLAPEARTDALTPPPAVVHRLTVVTRNVRDFDQLGVDLMNPFEHESEVRP